MTDSTDAYQNFTHCQNINRTNQNPSWTNACVADNSTGKDSYDSGGGGGRNIVLFQYYTWAIIGSSIAALGILGNMFSIIVLTHKRMRNSSSSVYMMALAVFDSVVLVSLLLFLALPTVHLATGHLKAYYHAYPYMHPWAYPTALTAQTCSIYTTVAFTIERYWAISRPLSAAKVCKESRAKKCVVGVLIFSILYNVPRMLEYHVVEVPIENSNATRPRVYYIYLYLVVMLMVPFAVLCTLNSLLIRAIGISRTSTGRVSSKQQRENNTSVMLASVVVVFLICLVPSIADNIFSATLDQDTLLTAPYVKLSCISSLMVIFNSASNFYLYCCFGQKFRQLFLRRFCPCLTDGKKKFDNASNFMPLSIRRGNTQSTSTAPPADEESFITGDNDVITCNNGKKIDNFHR